MFTLEERCKMAKLGYISVDDETALVTFRWTRGSRKRAFLVWKEKETGNCGKIHVAGKTLSSVCLCGYRPGKEGREGCSYAENAYDILDRAVEAAKQHGIWRIFTRIKQESFRINGAEFCEITHMVEVDEAVQRYGEGARKVYQKFSH